MSSAYSATMRGSSRSSVSRSSQRTVRDRLATCTSFSTVSLLVAVVFTGGSFSSFSSSSSARLFKDGRAVDTLGLSSID